VWEKCERNGEWSSLGRGGVVVVVVAAAAVAAVAVAVMIVVVVVAVGVGVVVSQCMYGLSRQCCASFGSEWGVHRIGVSDE